MCFCTFLLAMPLLRSGEYKNFPPWWLVNSKGTSLMSLVKLVPLAEGWHAVFPLTADVFMFI